MRAKSEERAPTILQLLAKLFLSTDVEPEQFIDMERPTNKAYDKKILGLEKKTSAVSLKQERLAMQTSRAQATLT